jgi:RimJ/RimL family protein N-acetyltransferase
VADRDDEGLLFLIENRGSAEPLGLFMFFPDIAAGEVRIGYVLAESAWGQGYATEVVTGFLRRWDEEGLTASLLAGVTSNNVASQRVLEKAGFTRGGTSDGILMYHRCSDEPRAGKAS